MLGNTYDTQNCSIAHALEAVGERWTLLILRDAIRGSRRFEDFLSGLGIARNVLTARLTRMVEQGLLERAPYQDRPVRHEYRLTDKGRDFVPVLAGLLEWGDRYTPCPSGPPAVITHTDCGRKVTLTAVCVHCDTTVGNDHIAITPGPGASG